MGNIDFTDPDELERLVEAKAAPAIKVPAGVTVITASGIKIRPIEWLWPGWLARGKIHILAGAPGTGKTSLAIALAATLTRAGRWPDGAAAGQGDVLVWSGEDDPVDTLVPRLMAAGAELSRVHIITGALDDQGKPRAFDPSCDMDLLADHVATMVPAPALLVIDPVVSAVAGDSHKNGEVRRALQPLVDLAMTRKIAVLGITHFSKGTAGRDPVERVTGSLAFGAVARIVMAAAKMPDDQGGGRILARGKSNIGKDDGGFAYDLEVIELRPGIETTCVTWGEAIKGTAREILSQAETQEDPDDKRGYEEAIEWLRDYLSDGPKPAKDGQRDAKANGITEKSLRTARDKLRVQPHKSGFRGGWLWSLPGPDPVAANPDHAEGAQNHEGVQGAQGNGSEDGRLAGQVAEFAHQGAQLPNKNGGRLGRLREKGRLREQDGGLVEGGEEAF